MKRSTLFLASLLLAGAAQANDGFNLGVGVDYSSGDYGTGTETTILSVPVTAKYTAGNWSFKASVPWMRVEGDPNVVPGLGPVLNTNPLGRGRAPIRIPGTGGGGTTPPTQTTSGVESGVGDLRVAATYSFDTGTPFGIDLTANAKIATADENKGLGTGANDYGVAVDLYRDFNGTVLFGGAGYTTLGDSQYIDVDSVGNANAGVSFKAGSGNLGVMYDWRESASTLSGDRSEVTGFYSVPAGESTKVQLYAIKGLGEGSPDWGAGISLSAGF